MRTHALWIALLLAGCAADPATPLAQQDAAPVEDTYLGGDDATLDALAADTTAAEAGTPDAPPAETAAPDVAFDGAGKFDILGTVSGGCGGLAAELAKPTPSLQVGELDFVAGETWARGSVSTPGGVTMFDTANAGGSSGESEVMSFELLHYCEDATLLKTETQILYAPPDDAGASTISDYEITIAGKKVGVSVTRAYKPAPLTMTDAEVQALIEKKLEGVNRSSVRVLAADRWVKQILHVFVADDAAEASAKRVVPTISAALRADTIIILTRTRGGGFLYCNPDPALGSECPAI
jgi:hypothetical protein